MMPLMSSYNATKAAVVSLSEICRTSWRVTASAGPCCALLLPDHLAESRQARPALRERMTGCCLVRRSRRPDRDQFSTVRAVLYVLTHSDASGLAVKRLLPSRRTERSSGPLVKPPTQRFFAKTRRRAVDRWLREIIPLSRPAEVRSTRAGLELDLPPALPQRDLVLRRPPAGTKARSAHDIAGTRSRSAGARFPHRAHHGRSVPGPGVWATLLRDGAG